MKTKLITLISVGILLTGAFTYARARWHTSRQPGPLATGFTIEFAMTNNGKVFATSTRYVKSNGEFLEDTNYLNPDGSSNRHAKLAGTIAHGAVGIDDVGQKLHYYGNAAITQALMSIEEIRANPHFVREDMVLGQSVFVTNDCIGSPAGRRCAEHWQAPGLGNELLKMVIMDDGIVGTIKEATKLQLGEPSFVVPDYPVDMTRYQELQAQRAMPSGKP